AGIVPGLALAGLFMLAIAIACILRPQWGGQRISASWSARIRSLAQLVPPIGIFLLVVGSIYAGIATPTEAAALGVVGALLLALFQGRLNWAMLRDALEGTMKSSAMIMLIVIGEAFLNFIMSAIGVINALIVTISGLGVSPMVMLLFPVLFYLVLGCFMASLAMMITTSPIVAPTMFALGFNPVWMGIVIIILVE